MIKDQILKDAAAQIRALGTERDELNDLLREAVHERDKSDQEVRRLKSHIMSEAEGKYACKNFPECENNCHKRQPICPRCSRLESAEQGVQRLRDAIDTHRKQTLPGSAEQDLTLWAALEANTSNSSKSSECPFCESDYVCIEGVTPVCQTCGAEEAHD